VIGIAACRYLDDDAIGAASIIWATSSHGVRSDAEPLQDRSPVSDYATPSGPLTVPFDTDLTTRAQVANN